ncbi:MAG TPA: response regulator transcription factor [Nitrolancea sp.]|nr:response regulator transcription factor [Nitrolancea sp.]
MQSFDGAKILIVEDEAMVADVVARYLRRDGFQVLLATDGQSALDIAHEQSPDLVLLDLMLPKLDGLEVCRRLRANSQVPIIVVTAKGDETDRIVGLELGADDYVSKPFSPRELVARVRAVLRRAKPAPSTATAGESLRVGPIEIDPTGRSATVENQPVELTAKEFDLLWFLMRNAGQVFSRTQLLDQVWDYDYFGDEGTVTVHIHRLRTKIEPDPVRPRFLKTVWGIGYKLEA